jgi:AGZA family xanthine/uracil permease-like MFS transporter
VPWFDQQGRFEDIFKYILRAAISIISGNIFYSIQARRLAMKTGRDDVTALPYGINTVSLFAYIFFIMAPVYNETKDPVFTWKIGLVACLFSGIIEIAGAFVGGWIRRVTPRAAVFRCRDCNNVYFMGLRSDFTKNLAIHARRSFFCYVRGCCGLLGLLA